MKLISLLLALLFLVILRILQSLGANLDVYFLVDLLGGLLPNILVFFIAIFMIDKLTKRIEVDKLKILNQNNAEFIDFILGQFIFNMLTYLGIIVKGEYTENMFNGGTERLLSKVEKIQNETTWNKIIYDKIAQSRDKYEYVEGLSKLVSDFEVLLDSSLKKIYPHPSPNVILMTGSISQCRGLLTAIKWILDSNLESKVNEELNIQKSVEVFNNSHIDLLIKLLLITGRTERDCFRSMFDSIKTVSDDARSNSLFIE